MLRHDANSGRRGTGCLRLVCIVLVLAGLPMRANPNLDAAASRGDLEWIKQMASNPGIGRGAVTRRALFVGAQFGRSNVVEWSLDEGVDVNTRGDSMMSVGMEQTALHLAIQGGFFDLAKLLVDRGADPNLQNARGETPLHYTVDGLYIRRETLGDRSFSELRIELAGFLIDSGGRVLVKNRLRKSPVDLAAEEDYFYSTVVTRADALDLLDLLLSRGEKDATTAEGNTLLHLAARWGREGTIDRLMLRGFDLKAINGAGRTALQEAAFHGQAGAAGVLMAWGAPLERFSAAALGRLEFFDSRETVTETNPEGETVLHWAAVRGQMPVLDWLIEKHPALVARTNRIGRTALHFAASTDQARAVERLLTAGADIDAADIAGDTPLHVAARYGSRRAVETLLAREASTSARNLEDQTPTDVAALGEDGELLGMLAAKSRPQAASGLRVTTPLHTAAYEGKIEVAEQLLKHGAEVNALDEQGWTAFMFAAGNRSYEFMLLLLRQGADPNIEDDSGNTPLHKAVQWDYQWGEGEESDEEGLPLWVRYGGNIGKFLLDHGHSASVTNRFGETPMHRLGKRGTGLGDFHTPIIRLLMKHGADVNAKDASGQTPLDVAIHARHRAVIEALEAAGAKRGVDLDDR